MMKRWIWLAGLISIGCAGNCLATPREDWDFKFKDFVIGGWWGPNATGAEMKCYKEAGFNVAAIGGYIGTDTNELLDNCSRKLELARKYNLAVFIDMQYAERPGAHWHPASLERLKWMIDQFGSQPEVIGFLLGDDQQDAGQQADCTKFLHEKWPHLMPWLCGIIPPKNLAANDNPIENFEIYPTLAWNLCTADGAVKRYIDRYAGLSAQDHKLGLMFWPIFNVDTHFGRIKGDLFGHLPSDSLVRFPAYAAVAFGAEGIWYFTYGGGGIVDRSAETCQTDDEMQKHHTPLYPIVQRVNNRIATWGPLVMGREAPGVFRSEFSASQQESPTPSPSDLHGAAVQVPEKQNPAAPSAAEKTGSKPGNPAPGSGKLIESMDNDLLAGVLTKAGKPPLVMVVNAKCSKGFGDLPNREVTLQFAPAVQQIVILEGDHSRTITGRQVTLDLEPGGGQMLELHGTNLEVLCSAPAIAALPK